MKSVSEVLAAGFTLVLDNCHDSWSTCEKSYRFVTEEGVPGPVAFTVRIREMIARNIPVEFGPQEEMDFKAKHRFEIKANLLMNDYAIFTVELAHQADMSMAYVERFYINLYKRMGCVPAICNLDKVMS